MVMVLGHTACGAIKGATATYMQCKAGRIPQVTRALDALLVGLSNVAKKASAELGERATEQQIVARTIKLPLGCNSSRLSDASGFFQISVWTV
eukprot:g19589.t1